jgi:hypothetical protein
LENFLLSVFNKTLFGKHFWFKEKL